MNNITIVEQKGILLIDDGLQWQHFLLKVMLSATLINSVVFTLGLSEEDFGMFGFLWIILGCVSLTLLLYQVLKKTAKKEIPLERIVSLEDKKMLGRRTLSLKLDNGKLRDLQQIRSPSEMAKLKLLLQKGGIEIL